MKTKINSSSFLLGLFVSIIILLSAAGGAIADRVFVVKPLDYLFPRSGQISLDNSSLQKGEVVKPLPVNEENAVVEVANQSKQSVVTVSIKQNVNQPEIFSFPGMPFYLETPGATEQIQQDIGTGFVVSQEDGFVVTNKHVVSNAGAEYILIDFEGNEHNVTKIYRDPINDLAILQTSARLPALPLADSDQIKVGQTAIAIGTALGEFRQTVTVGVVSGTGRGIEASDGFATVERIDNLIQTDAAINPGNSGGPLINLQGEVMGVNVAVAQAENIGFAIPINVVKDSIKNFNETGQFDRPMLGVRYKMIPQETAILNDVPEGAYIIEVLPNSTAAKMQVQIGDIITKLNGQTVNQEAGDLAALINKMRVGDTIILDIWRGGELLTLQGELQIASN